MRKNIGVTVCVCFFLLFASSTFACDIFTAWQEGDDIFRIWKDWSDDPDTPFHF